eukprot:TRINITY_DN24050_c0_g1_i1.p1 TRINITY_DN24050_c0_g1~~TRINITY_DN24050_c0_g1_i1.p1  ORF type:complete len:619 (-),score=80.77 TRINITY_DN24050_c0_g1_i1:138-1994(-)
MVKPPQKGQKNDVATDSLVCEVVNAGALASSSSGKNGNAAWKSFFDAMCACSACEDGGVDAGKGEDVVSRELRLLKAAIEHPQALFWRHSWKLRAPKSKSSHPTLLNLTLSGHSRSLERTGFVINELNIFLDAGVGWKADTANPEAILVTHGHIDHINALPLLLRCGDADPHIFVPRLYLNNVREMCRMTWAVKMKDVNDDCGVREDVEDVPNLAMMEGGGGDMDAGDDSEFPYRWYKSGMKSLNSGGHDDGGNEETGHHQKPAQNAAENAVKTEDVQLISKEAEQASGSDQTSVDSLIKPGSSMPTVTEAVVKIESSSTSAATLRKNWIATQPGLQYRMTGKGTKHIVVRTVHCYHKTGDVGYVVCDVVKSQRGATPEADAEFTELKKLMQEDPKGNGKKCGQQIGKLRKEGKIVDVEEVRPLLAYLLDTTVQVFGEGCEPCKAYSKLQSTPAGDSSPAEDCIFRAPAKTPQRWPNDWEACLCRVPESGHGGGSENGVTLNMLKAQLELIFQCPNIVIECTFLGAGGMTEDEADREAIKRTHTSWRHLKPYVLAHPDCTFVLVHFSRRYSDAEIRAYFAKERELDSESSREGARESGGFSNVVLWLDSGIVDFSVDR